MGDGLFPFAKFPQTISQGGARPHIGAGFQDPQKSPSSSSKASSPRVWRIASSPAATAFSRRSRISIPVFAASPASKTQASAQSSEASRARRAKATRSRLVPASQASYISSCAAKSGSADPSSSSSSQRSWIARPRGKFPISFCRAAIPAIDASRARAGLLMASSMRSRGSGLLAVTAFLPLLRRFLLTGTEGLQHLAVWPTP